MLKIELVMCLFSSGTAPQKETFPPCLAVLTSTSSLSCFPGIAVDKLKQFVCSVTSSQKAEIV